MHVYQQGGRGRIEAGYGEALVSNVAGGGLEVAGGGDRARLRVPEALHLQMCQQGTKSLNQQKSMNIWKQRNKCHFEGVALTLLSWKRTNFRHGDSKVQGQN